MKYAALSYSTNNIGDEIQSLAAIQYLPKIDTFIDRDHLDTANLNEKTKLIANGWFLGKPYNWPPHELISPLFISFHLTHKHDSLKYFEKKPYIDYLKKHEPIGCRDIWTLKFLQSLNIQSYFSGCLTLTLKNEFDYRTDNIYIVDAFSHVSTKEQKVFNESLVPKNIKSKVEFISHWNNNLSKDPTERLNFAKDLLKKYATAKLVITSRIHCALPCLAFNTPVYFVDIGYKMEQQRNRFEGLISHLETVTNKGLILPQSSTLKKLIRLSQINNLIFNKKIKPQINWKKNNNPYAKIDSLKSEMSSTVKNFINT